MDDVARTGEPMVITKRGREVVSIVRPASASKTVFPQQVLKGRGRTHGDIVSPVLPADAWEALVKGA